MSGYENLKIKSEHNYIIGEISQKNEYFDVAVSRYYYSLFQLINYILFTRKNGFKIPNSEGSHTYIITEFKRYFYRKYKDKLKDEDYSDLTVLDDFKRLRKQADYDQRFITEKEFTNDFWKKFNPCYNMVLSKLVMKEDK